MPEHIAPALGTIATVLFVVSQAPMLIKAARTKDLASYSGTNLVIANVGNIAQSGYVITLPAGPVWALHAFNTLASGCMLYWWLRYRNRGPADHRSSTSSPDRARDTHGYITASGGHPGRSWIRSRWSTSPSSTLVAHEPQAPSRQEP